MNPIYAQSLYELVELKKRIDPFDLESTALSIYKSIKAVGISNTTIKYKGSDGKEVLQKGDEIPLEMRAIAAFIVKLYYRWDDNMGRLEKHYGLPLQIDNILGNTGIFKTKGTTLGLPCISINDVIDLYIS